MSKNNSYNTLFFVICVAFLMLSAVSAYVFTYVLPEYLGLIVGTALMVVTIPFAVKFKKNKNVQIVVTVFNAIFTGMAISTFFVVKSYSNITALLNLIYAFLISVVIYILLYLWGAWNPLKNHSIIKSIINFSLFLGIIMFYVYGFIALNEPLFYALSTLTVIAFGIYIVSKNKIKNKRQLYNTICLSSYCIYIAVAIVVLMFLSDGEAADLGEVFAGTGTEGSNSKKKKKSNAALTTTLINSNESINNETLENKEEENNE